MQARDTANEHWKLLLQAGKPHGSAGSLQYPQSRAVALDLTAVSLMHLCCLAGLHGRDHHNRGTRGAGNSADCNPGRPSRYIWGYWWTREQVLASSPRPALVCRSFQPPSQPQEGRQRQQWRGSLQQVGSITACRCCWHHMLPLPEEYTQSTGPSVLYGLSSSVAGAKRAQGDCWHPNKAEVPWCHHTPINRICTIR